VLLDRQRVKFWQKWVFGFMAVIMAAFLLMIPLNRSLGCGGSSSATQSLDQEITRLNAAVQKDPKNAELWRQLAEAYDSRGVPSSDQTQLTAAQRADLQKAAVAYEKASRLFAKQKGPDARAARVSVLESLSSVYYALGDFSNVVGVYGRLTDLVPRNADYFFFMGQAAEQAGENSTAALAFTKYLELSPDLSASDKAALKARIATLSGVSSPTPQPTTSQGAGQ
jgi:tetratricopeptide (TPR) repeat protein